MTAEEVDWAGELLARITRAQWLDAFRVGGFGPAVAERLMDRMILRIEEARRIGLTDRRVTMLAPSSPQF